MLANMHATTGTAEATPADLLFGEAFDGEFPSFPFFGDLFLGEFFGDVFGDCFGDVAGVESFSPFFLRGERGDLGDFERGDRL